jgi:endoglucanase
MHRLITIIGIFAGLTAVGSSIAGDISWQTYQQHFLTSDGRVIDHIQQATSHSEGQGYGLLLAVGQRDRERFDRILQWTEANLQVRKDALSAWSWGRRRNGTWAIIDYNNATDGDLLIALALLQAHEAWRHDPYRQKALKIITDIRTKLAWEQDGYLLLAPAYYGFDKDSHLVVNSGYAVLPAFEKFAAVEERQFWQRVAKDSLRLLGKNRFARWRLPADWMTLKDGAVAVDANRSPYFGYEAIRVPLYLLWAGEKNALQVFSNYLVFTDKLGYLPDRINLIDGSISADEAPAGFYAIFAGCAEVVGQKKLAQKFREKAAARIKTEPKNYFSHTLYLLSREAF